MLVVALLTATACSDFSDYNETPADANITADRTLWENISQSSELSDFAALVKKAGFDDELSQSHFYTVWAPANGTYNAAALMEKDAETVLYQFVKNHIAEHNHVVSGAIDERIHSLNKKSYDFTGNGTYTYAGVTLSSTNNPSVNGIVHVLDGAADFYPNIYEYLFEAEGVDSVANYFKRYEISELDTKNSVLGPTVNGKQTYIDSVMITYNSALYGIRAMVEREDSSYSMIVPTDEAWVKQYDKIKSYFNYITTTSAQDVDDAKSTSSFPTSTVNVNAAYMADSMTVGNLVSNLVFNNNLYYNTWLEDESKQPYDTLVSTTENFFTNPEEIMSRTIAKHKMSNGTFYIVDSLAYHPWEAWSYTRRYSPALSRVWTGSLSVEMIDAADFDSVGYHPEYLSTNSLRYYWIAPRSNYGKPQLDVKLPDVLSIPYNIYIVLAPSKDYGTDDEGNLFPKPNMLDFTLSYCDAKGKLQTKKLNQKVVNDPTKVDTLSVGTFTFPVCYYGLGNKIYPNLKITTDFGVFDKVKMAAYTRDFRFCSIILKPVEQDEYEATKEN